MLKNSLDLWYENIGYKFMTKGRQMVPVHLVRLARLQHLIERLRQTNLISVGYIAEPVVWLPKVTRVRGKLGKCLEVRQL